jgi:outer membrane protein TolC
MQMQLPADIAVGVPSQLVERRPDVRAAEAQLHAATAQVGVAIANSAAATDHHRQSRQFRDRDRRSIQGRHREFWSVGASLSQTLFAGGTLVHRKRAADAALDQAGALYQSTVLTAFQNVADALHALETTRTRFRPRAAPKRPRA